MKIYKKHKKYIYIFFIITILTIYLLYKINTNTEYFIDNNNAYVINLDERNDRWNQIQESFKDSNISLVRISAVKHKIGHIGCGLSFMKIVRLAKEKKLKTVLIFEDDNKPLDNFDQRWSTIKNWLDNNLDKWEVFNGGARFENWDSIINEEIPESCKNIKLVNNINNEEYLFRNDTTVSTNWIYINSSVYDKVLKWETKIDYKNFNLFTEAIDRYITNSEKFNVKFCLPLLGLQQNGLSDTNDNTTHFNDFNKSDNLIAKIYKKVYEKHVII